MKTPHKFVDVTAVSNTISGDLFHCSLGMGPSSKDRNMRLSFLCLSFSVIYR